MSCRLRDERRRLRVSSQTSGSGRRVEVLNSHPAIRRRIYYAGVVGAALEWETTADGGIWRATPDDDEHYAYGVALR